MHPSPHGVVAARGHSRNSAKAAGLARLLLAGCVACLVSWPLCGGGSAQGAVPATAQSDANGAWWQVTLAYDEQGLTVLEAAPIRPMTKAVVTPGLHGAPVRLAYDVAWLDGAGAEMARATTEVPLGVRAAMGLGADPGESVVVQPQKGVRVLRLRGPRADAVPARLRLQRTVARDVVAADAGAFPPAFSAARVDLPLRLVRGPDAPIQRAPGPRSVAKVRDTGEDGNRLVLVVMGDGYTLANLDAGSFTTATRNLVSAFGGFAPWDVLFNGTNVYRVDVASNEQGADFETSSTAPIVDTYFNASFWSYGLDRLLALDSFGEARAVACADSFVGIGVWDDIFIIVNSTTYGGSGGTISVASVHPQATDVIRHEYGHTFAHLADEYSSPYLGYPAGDPEPNVDYDSSGPALKWIVWVEAGTPLPTPDTATYNGLIGAFEGARYLPTGIYRPYRNCLMRSLGQQFCPVCKEAHIVEYFRRMSPADAVTPDPAVEVPVPAGGVAVGIAPIPFSGFQYAWTLNGAPFAATGPSVTLTPPQLTAGVAATLQLMVSYPTALVRTSSIQRTFDWTVRAVEQPAGPKIPVDWTLY